jgi:hypothetical protein
MTVTSKPYPSKPGPELVVRPGFQGSCKFDVFGSDSPDSADMPVSQARKRLQWLVRHHPTAFRTVHIRGTRRSRNRLLQGVGVRYPAWDVDAARVDVAGAG